MPLTDWIWGTPEARLAKEQELALQELTNCFNDYADQKEQVAQHERLLEQRKQEALKAQALLQNSSKLYEGAMETMPVGSDERLNLRISFMKRESESQAQEKRVREADKDLKQALLLMIEKEKHHKTAQLKYDKLMGRVPAPEMLPIVPVVLIMPTPLAVSSPIQVPTTPSQKSPGRVVIPSAIIDHFNGNNREHLSTPETTATREEVAQMKSSIDVGCFRRQLNETLSLRVSTPQNTPTGSAILRHERTLAIRLEQKLLFDQDPELRGIVRNSLHFSFKNSPVVSAPKLPEALTEAIQNSRKKLGY